MRRHGSSSQACSIFLVVFHDTNVFAANPNATITLTNAVSSANSGYNASSAITVYVEEARNENA
jgi:hypothetical protein